MSALLWVWGNRWFSSDRQTWNSEKFPQLSGVISFSSKGHLRTLLNS